MKQFIESDNWYVLYTLPNYEKKVNSSLIRSQIPTFLPLQKVERIWSDRKKLVEVPLFPNYIFVKVPAKDRFKVLDVCGVKYYITFNGEPVTVDDKEISSIRKFVDLPGLDLERTLVKGENVRISKGPFEGLRGVLYEKMGQTRLCVRIESINQVLSIDVCSSWVEKMVN